MTETNFQILLPSKLHTHRLGVCIAQNIVQNAARDLVQAPAQNTPGEPGRLVIALTGPLGSGKTCLVNGIAEGLGVKENVNSPTFTLINEYCSGAVPLYHVDLYRLSDADKSWDGQGAKPDAEAAEGIHMLRSQLSEIFQQNGVVAIEWAELLQNYLPPDCLQISLSYVKDGTARSAELKGPGAERLKDKGE